MSRFLVMSLPVNYTEQQMGAQSVINTNPPCGVK